MIHDTPHRCLCGGRLEILENKKVSIYCLDCDEETVMQGKSVDDVRGIMDNAQAVKDNLMEMDQQRKARLALRKETDWFRALER